jgi:hypothetical protein
LIVLGCIFNPIKGISAAQASFYGNNLASCEEFAASFDNTCDEDYNPWSTNNLGANIYTLANMDSVEVNCPLDEGLTCPFTGEAVTVATPCTWERKLCVRC